MFIFKQGRMEQEEWDRRIMPLIDRGILKERKDLQSDGFLMIYQLFSTIIEDTDGKLYYCSGWASPSSMAHVEVTRYVE